MHAYAHKNTRPPRAEYQLRIYMHAHTHYIYTCIPVTLLLHLLHEYYTYVVALKYPPGPVSEHNDVPNGNVEVVGILPAERETDSR